MPVPKPATPDAKQAAPQPKQPTPQPKQATPQPRQAAPDEKSTEQKPFCGWWANDGLIPRLNAIAQAGGEVVQIIAHAAEGKSYRYVVFRADRAAVAKLEDEFDEEIEHPDWEG